MRYDVCRAACTLMAEFGYRDIRIVERFPTAERWVTGRITMDGLQFVLTVREEETVDELRRIMEHYQKINDGVPGADEENAG